MSSESRPWNFDWNDESLNAPELNSPQPCSHGAGCTYFGSCRFVHPGEEGTGRMRFDEREVADADGNTVVQRACVRLIGSPGYYRRCRARMSWPEFCARNSIPYTPNPPRPREDAEETPAAAADADANANEDGQQTPPPPRPWANRGARGGRVANNNRGGRREDVSGGAGSGRPWQPRDNNGPPRSQAPPRGRGAGGYVNRRQQPRTEGGLTA